MAQRCGFKMCKTAYEEGLTGHVSARPAEIEPTFAMYGESEWLLEASGDSLSACSMQR